jgi:1,4-dihydroxy-2-naphthoate polyprenyltransferase
LTKGTKIKAWLSAMRLRTLPLAASSIITGYALARFDGYNNTKVFFLALTTSLLLQILSNLSNDLGDFLKGTDNNNRVGPARALQSGALQKREMVIGVILTSLLCLVSGTLLLTEAISLNEDVWRFLSFFLLGLYAIAAAIRYTVGKSAYGYAGFGDVFVFVFFGWIGAVGTYVLCTGNIDLHVFLPASSVGAMSTMVLNLNNMRDHVNDAACGKRTMVVKIGFRKAKLYHLSLYLMSCVFFALWMLVHPVSSLIWLPALSLGVVALHSLKVIKTHQPAELDGQLKVVAILTFAFALGLFIVS